MGITTYDSDTKVGAASNIELNTIDQPRTSIMVHGLREDIEIPHDSSLYYFQFASLESMLARTPWGESQIFL